MMPPGHLAVTWGLGRLFQKNDPDLAKLDYRLLALNSMGPDIIDKPLALFVFTKAETSQLVAHSLLFNAILLSLILLFRPKALPYVLAFVFHLVADRMWRHTESFWWPLFGWTKFWDFKPMNTPESMLKIYIDIITRYPQVYIIEIIAIIYLLWFGYRHRLYGWPSLKQFFLTGHIN